MDERRRTVLLGLAFLIFLVLFYFENVILQDIEYTDSLSIRTWLIYGNFFAAALIEAGFINLLNV